MFMALLITNNAETEKQTHTHTQVDGEKYVGQGRSKKLARIQAAEAALRSFIQFKDGTALSPVKSTNAMDFTSDDHMDNNGEAHFDFIIHINYTH